MKAILVQQHGGPEELVPSDIAIPVPGKSQVLIRTIRASVNFADLMAVAGNYPVPSMPFVPGLDCYGEIVAVGADVDASRVGEKVVAFCDAGGYSEYSLASEGLFFPVPDGIDPDQAGAAPLLLGTCYGLLTQAAKLSPGATVAVHAAAGGIGTTAIQMALTLGASKVIGLVSSQAKAGVVESLGASAIVAPETSNYAQQVIDVAGAPMDIILNSVAGTTIAEDLEMLAPFGTLVTFGMAAGTPGVAYSNQLHSTSRTFAGYSFGNLRRNRPSEVASLMLPTLEMLISGRIKMVIDSVLDLDQAANAHARLASRLSIGKILLK